MRNKNLNFVTAAGLTTMTHRVNRDVGIGLVRVNYKFGPSGMFGPGGTLGKY
jgi:outer membrane immunogenic protein